MAENGLENVTLRLYVFAKYLSVAQVVQASLNQIGVNVEIVEWAQSGFTGNIRADNQYDMAINCVSQYGGVLSILQEYMYTGYTRSFMNYSNSIFDSMIDAGLKSPTYDDLIKAYAEVQQYVAEDLPGIPLCQAFIFSIGSKGFYGVDLNNQAVDSDFTYSYVIEN